MADQSGKAPIIIKKVKKVSGHGHHGGAWKVAYADFVTAMMAFFLLLWLLITLTGFGITDNDAGSGWYYLGTPILETQVLLAWLIASTARWSLISVSERSAATRMIQRSSASRSTDPILTWHAN